MVSASPIPDALRHLPEEGGTVHATTVALGPRALMICGPSGSGKSDLAVSLLAFGCALVADDRTLLAACQGVPIASAPPAIAGRIEARGLGILRVSPAPPTPLAAILNLSQIETERLPPHRTVRVLGCDIPLLHRHESAGFPAALRLYLEAERADR